MIVHSDHGFKFGEHGCESWSKCTNWEVDARVPLIIRATWIPGSVRQNTLAIAALVDIFPTCVDLASTPFLTPISSVGAPFIFHGAEPRDPFTHCQTHLLGRYCCYNVASGWAGTRACV